MPRAHVPSGQPLVVSSRRIRSVGFGLPRLLGDGASAASSSRPAISLTSGLAHSQGVWSQVVAALSEDVGFVRVTNASQLSSSGANTSALLNLGVGAALSEVVVLDSLGVGWVNNQTTSVHPGWLIPIFIAKGSRVAAQFQCAVAAQAASFRFEFFAPVDGLIPSAKVSALNANTATSRGTDLSTPASTNTKGDWTELVASTAEPYAALSVSIQGAGDTLQTTSTNTVDIAVGASGAEIIVVPDIHVDVSSQEHLRPSQPLVHSFPGGVLPKGSRIAARFAQSASGSSLDVIVHGIRPPL